MMRIWLPKPIYEIIPAIYLISGISFLLAQHGIIVIITSIYIFSFGGTIFVVRYVSRKVG